MPVFPADFVSKSITVSETYMFSVLHFSKGIYLLVLIFN